MKKVFPLLICTLILFISLVSCHKNDITDSKETNTASSQTDHTDLKENPVTDFEYEINPPGTAIFISKYIGTSDHVVIPAQIDGLPVLVISKGAFQNSNIRSVVIPDSVESIKRAFPDCSELEQVLFGENSQLEIVSGAFENCVSLERIDLSTTKLQLLELFSFAGCRNLKEVILPDTCEQIGVKAFYECSSLIEIRLPKSLKTIESSAFGFCTALKRVTVAGDLSLMSVEGAVFHDVPSLEEIRFEDGREEVFGYAFFGITSDVKIYVPQSVKRFSPLPFIVIQDGTKKTVEVYFEGDCPEITQENDYFGDPIIYYDPNTKNWENFAWKNEYPMIPIK